MGRGREREKGEGRGGEEKGRMAGRKGKGRGWEVDPDAQLDWLRPALSSINLVSQSINQFV